MRLDENKGPNTQQEALERFGFRSSGYGRPKDTESMEAFLIECIRMEPKALAPRFMLELVRDTKALESFVAANQQTDEELKDKLVLDLEHRECLKRAGKQMGVMPPNPFTEISRRQALTESGRTLCFLEAVTSFAALKSADLMLRGQVGGRNTSLGYRALKGIQEIAAIGALASVPASVIYVGISISNHLKKTCLKELVEKACRHAPEWERLFKDLEEPLRTLYEQLQPERTR